MARTLFPTFDERGLLGLAFDPDFMNNQCFFLAGHSSGILIVPGDSEHSVLYMRITGTGLGRMPPGGPFTAQLISLIKTWIDEGAKDN